MSTHDQKPSHARHHARTKARAKRSTPERVVHPSKLTKAVPDLKNRPICELPALFEPWTGKLDPGTGLFSCVRTFWLFLSQVLSSDGSCQEAVTKALAWIALQCGQIISSNTSAYCQARARLGLQWLLELFSKLTQNIQAQSTPSGLWCNRTVKIVDGSSVSMPDTPKNQELYPQPKGQKPGCGFPVMHLVVFFSLATGAVIDFVWGALDDHERTLWHKLWRCLKKADVVLADRGFCSFADFYLLRKNGFDCVMRLHQRRSSGVKKLKSFGRGDKLVEWIRSGACPKWLEKSQWKAMPTSLVVRQISFSVDNPGFRSQAITIVTTLTDPKAYPRQRFVELFRRRWLAELFLRDIKVSMGMDPLRCKSPEMAQKELVMYMTAYNLVRAMMLKAAERYLVQATRLSFKHSMAFMRQWAPLIQAQPGAERQQLIDILLYHLACQVLPERPDRVEPRALKRRHKNYQFLTKPRHEFHEIQHRNSYTCKTEAATA